MISLIIFAMLLSPIAFLAIGFHGVSRKRAEEGREAVKPFTQSTPPLASHIDIRSHKKARTDFREADYTSTPGARMPEEHPFIRDDRLNRQAERL